MLRLCLMKRMKAKQDGAEVLFIDTAGRLHNKANLMAELEKITRVLKKQDESCCTAFYWC